MPGRFIIVKLAIQFTEGVAQHQHHKSIMTQQAYLNMRSYLIKAEPMSVVTRPGCTATNVKPCAAVTSDAQLRVTAGMDRHQQFPAAFQLKLILKYYC